jgi:hypothetical protein
MMNKLFTIVTSLIIACGIFLVFGNLILYPSGSAAGYTGSPSDGQDCGSCHGYASSPKAGVITSNIPAAGYTPGSTYNITVTLTGSGKKGFEVSPQNSSGTLLGTLTAGTGMKLLSSGKYITHNSAISTTPATWTFQWKAPVTGTGNVTFYGAFVIGYSNIYTSSLSVSEAQAAIAPSATTLAATNLICAGEASLNGIVNPNGASTAVTFQYGTTIDYGSSIVATPSPLTGSTSISVSAQITGLLLNTPYHYRVNATSINGTTNGTDMTFTIVPQNIYTIDGVVSYDNSISTPLNNISLSLLNSQNSTIGTTTTDINGHYAFNNLGNGTYTISPSTSNKVGGIDATDALIINKYFIQDYTFTSPLRQKAADVDAKNGINPTDALNIMRFFVKLTSSFTAGSWLFDPIPVNVNCSNSTQNIKAICIGDANGSYKP